MTALGMHMADQLLSPAVAFAFIALSGAVLVGAARATQARFDPARVPLMGVLGAFVFAAQMINFPILPFTSGHLGGGVLLAILLGPHAGALVMASILIVQALIFQDGGILAIGTNVLNLGILPCYVGWTVYRLVSGTQPRAARLYAAVFIATLVGMLSGAAMVPVQATMSGVLTVSFSRFLLAMLGLHLLIALVEALITFGVIAYIGRVRSELLGDAAIAWGAASQGIGRNAVLTSLLVTALLLGGIGSLFASQWPDALDSLTSGDRALVVESSAPVIEKASDWQTRLAPLPDYRWTSLSGILGTIVTLLVVWGIGRMLRREGPRAPVQAPQTEAETR